MLFDFGNKVNTVQPTFIKKLSFLIRPSYVGAQKIDGTILNNYGMVLAAFSVINKANQGIFFEETFLMANVSLEIVL